MTSESKDVGGGGEEHKSRQASPEKSALGWENDEPLARPEVEGLRSVQREGLAYAKARRQEKTRFIQESESSSVLTFPLGRKQSPTRNSFECLWIPRSKAFLILLRDS